MFLKLNDLKKHLNVDADFTEDDDYIMTLGEVAEQIVQKHIDTRLTDIVTEEGQLPMPILHAMKLLVGNLYANREAVTYGSATELPKGYDYLLSLYKHYNNTEMNT